MGGDASTELQGKITMDVSDAQDGLSGFGDALSSIGDIAGGIIVAGAIQNLIDQITQLGTASISSSANLQNVGVSMQYAFGQQTQAVTQQLNNLSQKVPLTNAQLETMATQLKNMGEAGGQVTQTLSAIVNTTSATSASFDQIGQNAQSVANILAIAFNRGTVNAIQLRGIAAQVPGIYQAVANEINKAGTATVESVTAINSNAKAVATATTNNAKYKEELINDTTQLGIMQDKLASNAQTIADYQTKIQNAQNALQVLGEKHVYGALAVAQQQDAINSAEASITSLQQAMAKSEDTSAQTLAIQKQEETIANLNAEITKTGDAMQSTGAKATITVADLTSTTKSIAIPAQILNQALIDIGTGKYAGAANAQMKTLNGTMDVLSKTFLAIGQEILGFDANTNTVIQGGLFSNLQKAAQGFLGFLQDNKGNIITFGQNIIQVFEQQVAPALQTGFQWILDHKAEIAQFVEQLIIDFGKFSVYMVTHGLPILEELTQDLIKMQPVLQLVATLIGDVGNALSFLTQAGTKANAVNLGGTNGGLLGVLGLQANLNATQLTGGLQGGLIGSLLSGKFATGTNSAPGGLALVGENGPEIVNLPQGSAVTPASQVQGNTSVVINNPVVNNDAQLQQMINQVRIALGRQNYLAQIGAI